MNKHMKTMQKPPENTPAPQYALRKGLGFWELTFNGQHAVFKHEQGAYYVAYLLLHPPEQPIHALDLATRVQALQRKRAGLPELIDPDTGRALPLDQDATLQQRSLGLEAAETMRAVLRRQNLLEDLCEDEHTTEAVKREAERELIELYRYEENNTARTRDSAQRCVRAVRMAINRFYRHLAAALDAQGHPHPVLRAFAVHLEKYLLLPSLRFSVQGRLHAQSGLAGCFTYEPPGVVWTH